MSLLPPVKRTGGAKLTVPEVRSIRESLARNNAKERMHELAEQYGVAYNTIWRIDRNLIWRWVQT